jgi:hypothetical protein
MSALHGEKEYRIIEGISAMKYQAIDQYQATYVWRRAGVGGVALATALRREKQASWRRQRRARKAWKAASSEGKLIINEISSKRNQATASGRRRRRRHRIANKNINVVIMNIWLPHRYRESASSLMYLCGNNQ